MSFDTQTQSVLTEEHPSAVSVLIVDDEDSARNLCSEIASESGLRVRTAATTEHALDILEQFPVDILITDLKVPLLGGLELLKRVRENYPQTMVMVLTQYGTIESAIEATRLGATDYLTKPFHVDDLRAKLERLVHSLEVDQENRVLREQLRTRPGFGGLIGVSPKMQRVYKLIEKVSQHNYPVLILGESGTGKELVARSIHFSGPRRNKPFVPINCAAIPETLIESEIFGHEKGAFTGAMHSKQGLLEVADNGTLFLDEIGDLPVDLQAKLLRAVESGEFTRVGGMQPIRSQARIIAATNTDLANAVEAGTFRGDLLYRLRVVLLWLPPLRERPEDIPILTEFLLRKHASRLNKPVTRIADDALQAIVRYRWPGNIRELENVLERAVIVTTSDTLTVHDLPADVGGPAAMAPPEGGVIEAMERTLIEKVLAECDWNKSRAARRLGVGRRTLYSKAAKYGIRLDPDREKG
jgi:two-component system response regulator HydG